MKGFKARAEALAYGFALLRGESNTSAYHHTHPTHYYQHYQHGPSNDAETSTTANITTVEWGRFAISSTHIQGSTFLKSHFLPNNALPSALWKLNHPSTGDAKPRNVGLSHNPTAM
jgi:hypothetical protein